MILVFSMRIHKTMDNTGIRPVVFNFKGKAFFRGLIPRDNEQETEKARVIQKINNFHANILLK